MSSFLVAVDPGLHTAISVFKEGFLVHVFLVNVAKKDTKDLFFELKKQLKMCEGGGSFSLVFEQPEVYKQSPVPPNDLIELSIRLGVVVGLLSLILNVEEHDIHFTLPKDWKGQVPKEICKKRMEVALNINEKEVLNACRKATAYSYRHNLDDSVGIGLVTLKRKRRGLL